MKQKKTPQAAPLTKEQYWRLRALTADFDRLRGQQEILIQKRAALYAETGLKQDVNYLLDDEQCTATPQ